MDEQLGTCLDLLIINGIDSELCLSRRHQRRLFPGLYPIPQVPSDGPPDAALCICFSKGRTQHVLPDSLHRPGEGVSEVIFHRPILALPQEDATTPGLDTFPPSQQGCAMDSICFPGP